TSCPCQERPTKGPAPAPLRQLRELRRRALAGPRHNYAAHRPAPYIRCEGAMLDSAEAELYLRMFVERVLVDGVRRRDVAGVMSGGYTPSAAAAALVAVGAIKRELAEEILIDFDLACTLRGGGGPGVASRARASMQAPPSAPGKALTPRVAPCRGEF